MKNAKLILALRFISLVGFSAAPLWVAVAINFPNPSNVNALPVTVRDTTDIEAIATGVANWFFWGLILLSIIMFFVGGYRYVTSGGEPEKVRSANKTLLYAAIAVVVALVAAGMPFVIASLFR